MKQSRLHRASPTIQPLGTSERTGLSMPRTRLKRWLNGLGSRTSVIASSLRRRPVRYALVLVFFTVVTLLWLLPLVTDLGGSLLGEPNDGSGSLREYWAANEQGKSVFTWKHDSLATAPEGLPRSGAVAVANAAQPAAIMALTSLFGWLIAWNLFLIAGFILTGFLTFVLLDHLRLSFLPALFGSYVFAFNGFTFEKALFGQSAYVHAWIFPLLALTLIRVREHRTVLSAAIVGVTLALAFYLQSYFGLLGVLVVVVFAVVDVVLARGWAERLWSLMLFDAALVSTALFLTPALVLWLTQRAAVAVVVNRPIGDLQTLGASLSTYLLPSGRHPLLGSFGDLSRQSTSGEPTLFFGYTTIALAVYTVAVVLRRQERLNPRTRLGYTAVCAAVLVPAAFFASLPRNADLFGVTIPTPAYAIGEIVTFWRVYARFGLIVGLGLVVLAAIGLDHLSRRRHGRALTLAALALVAFELAPSVPVPTWAANHPPAYVEWLARNPEGIVAYYPEPEVANASLRLMNRQYSFQRFHGHRLFNLWGGNWKGTRTEGIRILSKNPDDPLASGLLAAEHVRYVLILDDVYRDLGQQPPTLPRSTFRLAANLDHARIFELRAKPLDPDRVLSEQRLRVGMARALAPAAAEFGANGFNAPELYADGRRWSWLRQDGVLHVDNASEARHFEFIANAFSTRRPRVLELVDESGDVLGREVVWPSQVEVRIGPIALPPGRSQLILRATPGPELLGERDRRYGSIFVSPVTLLPLADYAAR